MRGFLDLVMAGIAGAVLLALTAFALSPLILILSVALRP